mgnify:FL=1
MVCCSYLTAQVIIAVHAPSVVNSKYVHLCGQCFMLCSFAVLHTLGPSAGHHCTLRSAFHTWPFCRASLHIRHCFPHLALMQDISAHSAAHHFRSLDWLWTYAISNLYDKRATFRCRPRPSDTAEVYVAIYCSMRSKHTYAQWHIHMLIIQLLYCCSISVMNIWTLVILHRLLIGRPATCTIRFWCHVQHISSLSTTNHTHAWKANKADT